MAMKPVDVRRAVEEAVQACQAEVGVSVAADVPPVAGDSTAIVRAVRNLVENALVHGGMPVTVDVSAAGGAVRIAVEDRGNGLPSDELKRLWDPFYRGQRAQAEQRPGSGLGLALVQRIAKAHGGRVEAENIPGGGARFTMSLPRAEDRKDDERAANPAG
jgi:signal transduction histidine kinase